MSEEEAPEDYIASTLGGGGYLPPIYRIKIPQTRTQTAKVRWLAALGYPVKEISKGLNIRYQQVRNMVTTEPKRAAREDMPELKIELLEIGDEVEALLDAELDRTFTESSKSARRRTNARRRALEDAYGNEDLDDENYGR